jgi:hypothetical protein
MFDLTPKIQLDPESHKKYMAFRIMLHIVFVIAIILITYRILFPTISMVFSFANVNSLKNTLVSPRISSAPDKTTKGQIGTNETLLFNANPVGNFSTANFTFTTDEKSAGMEKFDVKLRKSYQAFFYPNGKPAGFKNGTLLSSSGSYYIISDDKLRKFSEAATVLEFGYSKNSFLEVSQNDLLFNEIGDEIGSADSYPDDTLFAIGETYYQMRNKKLFPFVSTRAFFSQFEANQAIIKNEDFFNSYPVSDGQLGFADGTLASFEQSAFILSEGKSYPIADAETFMQMGFDWDNVVSVNSEELNIYKKQKQFDRNQPHPNGTLFFDQATETYFTIKNNEKHPIENATVIKNYSKQKFVIANSKESATSVSCLLEKSFTSRRKYHCDVPIDSFEKFLGNDYQIETKFTNEARISDIEATFSTPFSWLNLRSSLSKIKENLRNNYIPTQQ